jgi:hypothetical protein
MACPRLRRRFRGENIRFVIMDYLPAGKPVMMSFVYGSAWASSTINR